MPRVNRQAYKAAQNIDLTADGNLDISLSVFLCLYILMCVHVANVLEKIAPRANK